MGNVGRTPEPASVGGRNPVVRVVDDPAAEVAALLVDASAAGGQLVLTGGSSPRTAYEIAAQRAPDWSGAAVWMSDERCVPPHHPDSNFGMIEAALLSRLTGAPEVHRMQGELGDDAGAGAYEAELRERLGNEPRFDLVLLGIGPDGHTASLFPGKPEVEERSRLVIGVPTAGMEPQIPRISLTLPAINAARSVVFLVTGASKAQAVARVFGSEPDLSAPAARVAPTAGSLTVLLDEAAAAGLSG
jgi:6-phosphogluconolactonase